MNKIVSPVTTLTLVLTYAKLIDDRRFDELRELMCDDLHFLGSNFEFKCFTDYRSGLDHLLQYKRTVHFVGNHLGEWQGEEFIGDTYGVSSHLYEQQGEVRKFDMGVRYRDRIIREAGKLKFKARTMELLWSQDLPEKLTI